MTYFVNVSFNYPLIVNTSIDVPNIKMIVFTTKTITYDVTELFINPEPNFDYSMTYTS
jgi:hypothetical protein